jgi:fatty acid desaturase
VTHPRGFGEPANLSHLRLASASPDGLRHDAGVPRTQPDRVRLTVALVAGVVFIAVAVAWSTLAAIVLFVVWLVLGTQLGLIRWRRRRR